ncbi:MAG: NnrU family protein [Gammaproteobacteria bacterium]|nr:NnrU family protein [Gammaproteobacteria bacterium]MCP5426277.1 NnrU family protein [Gammaproteobacteria bacterium]
MEILMLSSAGFLLGHVLLSGSSARSSLVGRLGQGGFMALYSIVALMTLGTMIYAYETLPTPDFLWFPGHGLRHLPLLVMPFALILLAGGYGTRNPSAVGMAQSLERPDVARGVLRITRHPIMWGIMLWAGAHVLANGDLGSLVFFGGLLLTALLGSWHLDRRLAADQGERWQRFVAVTSYVPFAAIIQGRQSLIWRELLLPIGVGSILYVALLLLHARLFGVVPY